MKVYKQHLQIIDSVGEGKSIAGENYKNTQVKRLAREGLADALISRLSILIILKHLVILSGVEG